MMRRAFVLIAIASTSFLGFGCVRPAGTVDDIQSGRSGYSARYGVGAHVGDESAAYVEGLLHGRITAKGIEPPESWSVRWSIWPLFGKEEGPFNAEKFGF